METKTHRGHRVVITGIGLLTPVGHGVQNSWAALLAGKSGGAPIRNFEITDDYDVRFAAEVKDWTPDSVLDRKEAKRTDRFAQFAIWTAEEAVVSAGLKDNDKVDLDRIGVIIGSGIGGITTFEDQARVMVERGPKRISPFFIPMFIPDIAAGHVSMRYGFRGPNYCTVSACASSAHAVGDAVRILQRGDADIMITGGAEATVTPMTIAGFANMKALSARNESPETASRPFDGSRDGFVLGEGAGVVVLETLEHALGRGANIIAEVVGFGQSGDAYHLTAPAPEGAGAQLAMRHALADAGIAATDVDYINAHGTSTPMNDQYETQALKTVFGEHAYKLPISSTKSMVGHLLGAAGAIEAGFCVQAIGDGVIPPTINYSTPDPDCDLDYTPNTARTLAVTVALTNSLGFGGHNASLVFRRFEA